MTGLTYPYTKYDRLLGDRLDLDLEFSPGPLPPSGTAGGAGRFKYWVDTSTPLPSLRQCVVTRATAGVYVAAEWITLGTIDVGVFHFNVDDVDFTGGSGALLVTNLTVTGTLSVGGSANLTALHVSGNTSLHNTDITGGLSVTGNIGANGLAVAGDIGVGSNLSVTGNISGATLGISGVSTLHNTTVVGTLTVTGNTGLQSLTVAGNLAVTGATTLTSLTVSGNSTLNNLTVTGTLTAGGSSGVTSNGPIVSTGPNAALSFYDRTNTTHYWTLYSDLDLAHLVFFNGTTGSVPYTFSSTGNLSVTGGVTAGNFVNGPLYQLSGNLFADRDGTYNNIHNFGGGHGIRLSPLVNMYYSENHTFALANGTGLGDWINDGLHVAASVYAEQLWLHDAPAGPEMLTLTVGVDLITSQMALLILGPEYSLDSSGASRVGIYRSGQNYYKSSEHNFWSLASAALVFAVFNSSGTSNVSGSWNVISDDTVKENIAPYEVGLAELRQLDIVSYNYMVPDPETHEHWSPFGALPTGVTTPQTRYGLMASNAQAVIPEMVTEGSFGDIEHGIPERPMLSIAPTHLVWVLVNSCKTLAAQDDTILSQIAALDARITSLEQATTLRSE